MKTSCTIIISHYESLPFLDACIRQIRKYRHPKIKQVIRIADQSSGPTWKKILEKYGGDEFDDQYPDVIPMSIPSHYSGFGVDYILRTTEWYVNTDYVCQLHVDAFPIHKNWLYVPIMLMQKYSLAFAGQLHFYSRPTDTIYPPGDFYSMSPTFNVGTTFAYKEMALEAGFTRFHERTKSTLKYSNNDWVEWAAADYEKRGSDDDVVAYWWADKYRNHYKLGFGLTGLMGIPGKEPGYGRIIEDLVFHFGFCRESIGVQDHMGANYREWTRRINEGFSDELIEEMLTIAKSHGVESGHVSGTQDRTMWNGTTNKLMTISPEVHQYIEDLKSH